MRERRFKLAGMMLTACVFAGSGSAQDGTGRSESVEKPTVVVSRRKVHRESARTRATLPPVRRVSLGKLSITVNGGDSQVRITRVGSEGAPDLIPVNAQSTSLIVRTLPAGEYRIEVTKPGYFEEVRGVEVADGTKRKVAINLKPKMAFLSLSASVPDAKFEIETVGAYSAAVHRLVVKPGKYLIKVTRRGYISQNLSVNLRSPGREEVVAVVLQPLRIDDVLDAADSSILKGNYTSAAELANDVLILNAAHARANLVFGLVQWYRSKPDTAEFLGRAIRNGETFKLAVQIRDSDEAAPVNSFILVDREKISLQTDSRFDLNYSIGRHEIVNILFLDDQIVLTARTDFHGRPITPELKISLPNIEAYTSANTTGCGVAACPKNIEILGRLLSSWHADASSGN